MERKKFNILNISLEKIIFGFLIGLTSFTLNFTFSQNSFAEYKATLSASISESTASIDGTEIIESSDETAEHEINLKINTTNKTGYTATISAKTEETALLNTNPAINTKINSISSTYSLANFPANTWGYRFDDNVDFSPIPAQSAPVNLIKTTEKPTEEENHKIKLGMKLDSSLKPGNYENRLIVSVVSNPYTPKAVMDSGYEFNMMINALLRNETVEMKHFKKGLIAPASTMNVKNIENRDSDYEIKLWVDPVTESVYYYADSGEIYLNEDSSSMFGSVDWWNKIGNFMDIDLSGFNTSKVTNMENMFRNMSNLTTLNLSNFNTSQVTSMSHMFHDMSNLTTLNLSNFNTSNVTSMDYMFYGMSNLTILNLSIFDTSMVTSMNAMFYGMSNLAALNLSNFDTSKVTSMFNMFSGMTNLTSLNLSNFDTSNVTSMGGMFYDLLNLATLDLSNFDTSKVTDMSYMFYGMNNLIALDISNFNTSKVANITHMFSTGIAGPSSEKLERIYVNQDFDVSKLTSVQGAFIGRYKLRGGNGSYLSYPATADLTWLRVDRPGVQGYFTRKS